MRWIARILHHLEQRTVDQLDGLAFAALFLVEVAPDRVDVIGEGGGVEEGDQRGHFRLIVYVARVICCS